MDDILAGIYKAAPHQVGSQVFKACNVAAEDKSENKIQEIAMDTLSYHLPIYKEYSCTRESICYEPLFTVQAILFPLLTICAS